MSTAISFLGALLVLTLLLVAFVVMIYNRLVGLRNQFRNAYAQIDVQLKRRYDLIPNLVETAKGYLQHERETLEAVIAARNTAAQASKNVASSPENTKALGGLISAEGALTGALGRLLAVVESYPDLKASSQMSSLMEELSSTENRIAFARQAFNDSVMGYNTAREKFPNILLAEPLGFKEASLFEIETPKEKLAPEVSFTDS